MPDPFTVFTAVATAAAIAALASLACSTIGPRVTPAFQECGEAVGIGSGAVAGMVMLGVLPSGRFVGDQERLAFIVLPLITIAETATTCMALQGWRAAVPRVLVALSVCPILLFGSVYLPSASWAGMLGQKPGATILMLGGAGLALSCGLLALVGSRRRPQPACLPLCLGLTIAAAGMTTVLSGYLTGGLAALPIAAALLAVSGLSRRLAGHSPHAPGTGVGVIGLAAILIIGHCFGSLTSLHAAALGAAPFVPLATGMAGMRRLPAWQHGMIAVGLTVALLGGVVWHAQARFHAAYAPQHKAAGDSPTIEDYLNLPP